MSWKQIQQAADRKRRKWAAIKKFRTCTCGTWMERAGEYHYECPKCGAKKLRS